MTAYLIRNHVHNQHMNCHVYVARSGDRCSYVRDYTAAWRFPSLEAAERRRVNGEVIVRREDLNA